MGYQKSARFRKYADEAAQGAKRIITISNDNNSLVAELFPGSEGKTVFLRNGYDTERFFPEPTSKERVYADFDIKPRPLFVLFAGKLAHFKGVDVLLEAAHIYEGEHPGQIVTVIAGDGELARQIKQQAMDYKLDGVHFLGMIDITRLRELYSNADVCAVPSRREPFGLVAIEALACGCPVVATNQGGLPDIINDDVGALVDVDDAFGLATALQRELFRDDKAERREKAAKYAHEKYAQDAMMDAIIGVYNS
jgi:glycosyltransferase involved in cell wall biosynthesis